MKHTTDDWVRLIRYRMKCEKDGYPSNYLSIVINDINDICTDTVTPLIFMDNIGHVLTVEYLNTLTVKQINQLFTKQNFATTIKTFLSIAEPLALRYTEDFRINFQQYHVFKKLLSFEGIQNAANIDKKRFILYLKRSKNNEDVL